MVTLAYGDEAVIAPLRVAFPPRVHAAFHQKYEGMGWKTSARRGAFISTGATPLTCMGKLQHGLLLEHFALRATDYHAQSPLGRDIYKTATRWASVRSALMSTARSSKCPMCASANGAWFLKARCAIAELSYNGWQVGGKSVDLTSRFTIWAGTHGFEHAVTAQEAAAGSNLDGLQLVTGLPVKADLPALRGPRYLATWGHQVLRPGATASDSLPDQNLGLAIVLPTGTSDAAGLNDPNNHLLRLPLDAGGRARFGVLAVDQEAPDDEPLSAVYPGGLSGPHWLCARRTSRGRAKHGSAMSKQRGVS